MRLATTLFALMLTVPAAAQVPDLLRQEEERARASQRLQQSIAVAIADAQRLEAGSPARARERLLKARIEVENAAAIDEPTRRALLAKLNLRITAFDRDPSRPDPVVQNPVVPAAQPAKPLSAEAKEQAQARLKAMADEQAEIRRTLDTIQSLNRAGDTAQASREAYALLKKYPNNPAALAMEGQGGFNDRVADAKTLLGQQQQSYLAAMRTIDKSAMPPKGDIEFDVKHFKEITELRKTARMTEKERRIMKSLSDPVDVNVEAKPFSTVIQTLSTQMKLPILLDEASLKALEIDSNTPVTLNLGGVSGRTALRKVLQDRGLTFVIKDETVQVMSMEKAREQMVTRVYYLGDLVSGVGTFGGAATWGPWIDQQQTLENAEKIVATIKQSIDPQSWKGTGTGNGTITFHMPSLSLIVRQTAEVQLLLGNSLGGK